MQDTDFIVDPVDTLFALIVLDNNIAPFWLDHSVHRNGVIELDISLVAGMILF